MNTYPLYQNQRFKTLGQQLLVNDLKCCVRSCDCSLLPLMTMKNMSTPMLKKYIQGLKNVNPI